MKVYSLYSAFLRQVTMKILFLFPYPLKESPSQRFRFEQYFDKLKANGHTYYTQSFLTSGNWQLFYNKGKAIEKVWALALGFVRRIKSIFVALPVDRVFIHREALPIGFPVMEWILAKVLRKKIIYDFDDAIWLTDKTNESKFEKLIRFRGKVGLICKWSYKISCGNAYLASYARKFNQNVFINPTTIDLESVDKVLGSQKPQAIDESIVIGWTGSHTTLKYLKTLEQTLQYIEQHYPNVSFLVIANHKPELQLKRLKFIKWCKETEVADLSKISIGVMPMPDDEWTKGKCGFKALQYMALSIPTVASPVGVNTQIIQHGKNGLLASTPEEWIDCLKKLIEDRTLRKQLGKNGRGTVEKNYSVSSNSSNFLSLFE
jgi:glycosyltransferase involved in cell wall biosynthesis